MFEKVFKRLKRQKARDTDPTLDPQEFQVYKVISGDNYVTIPNDKDIHEVVEVGVCDTVARAKLDEILAILKSLKCKEVNNG
jgi:hypothetical protein